MIRAFLFIVFTVVCVSGFFRNGPCDIAAMNNLPGPNDTKTMVVPAKCDNGTFTWDYPQGTIILSFQGRTVCIRDALGGDIFSVFDVTGGQTLPMEKVTRGSTIVSCTELHSSPITLRFVAPKTQYYMGSVAYTVMT